MKQRMSVPVFLAFLACGLLAGPALAQQSGGSKLAEEARALAKQYVDAFNRKDAAAAAAFYAKDGVIVTQTGEVVSGRPAIEKLFSTAVGAFTLDLALDQVHATGNGGGRYPYWRKSSRASSLKSGQ
jgi:ketosteroid isomerase-like protein